MADWLYFDKDTDDDSDLISRRAEIFRSKLITNFKLLDKFTEYGHHRRKGVLFNPDDIENEHRSKIVLLEQPDGLVAFQPPNNRPEVIGDRRTNRLAAKTSSLPPLYLWAHWVVESPSFQNGILVLILLNSIVLGIQGELENMVEPWVDLVKLVFDTFDYFAMFIYVMEIMLKWLDSFTDFWKSSWNVFDCVVTFMFLIPEVMNWSTGEFGKRNPKQSITVLANNLRSFRVLRTLKVVSRFQKIRLIIMAVTKAFQAMVFISLLLFTFAYIFSIIGVMFLQEGYTKESVSSLNYPKSFSGIGYALITLFQLFTLDHWLDVYQDMKRVGSPLFSICYIVIWILLGSFIFNNIFVGIMVNNFQSIRTELFKEVQGAKQKLKRESQLQELAENLEKKRHKTGENEESKQETDEGGFDSSKMPFIPETILEEDEEEEEEEEEEHKPKVESHTSAKITEVNEDSSTDREKESAEWVKTIEDNLESMRAEEQSFIWPPDTLFRYFRIMEVLMENLRERQEIIISLNETLLQIQDN